MLSFKLACVSENSSSAIVDLFRTELSWKFIKMIQGGQGIFKHDIELLKLGNVTLLVFNFS